MTRLATAPHRDDDGDANYIQLPVARGSSQDGVRVVWQRLAPVPESIQVGRWLTVRACDRWGLSAAVAPARQVATELIGNAVHHAGTPFDLTLTYAPPLLHIAVRDKCPVLPRQRTPETAEDNGRGMLLIEAFASSHGVMRVPGGKVVWAAVPAS